MVRLSGLLLLFLLWWPNVPCAVELPPEQVQVDEPIALEANLTASGSTLYSLPLDPGSLDVGDWLLAAGLSAKGVHGWDAQAQKYVQLKNLRPGEGFLLARGPGKVTVAGKKVVADTVLLPLAKGWNLIGVPYETGIALASLKITLEGKTESYLPAVEKRWVGGVNSLIDGKMAPLVAASAVLEPWRGYWFYAYQPCQLTFPALQPTRVEPPAKGHLRRKSQ